ncbi:MAG: hypothetical protein JSR78_19660 [Proteobacteria bacterium]|nr:hypothetical protein [Pseudomonadota bacterium]
MQDFLAQSFADGSIVYVIFAFMFIEGIALIAFRRVTGSGPGVGQILSLMLPGAFLLMALKAALGGAPWPMIACWLLAALIAHLADVWGRLNYEAGVASQFRLRKRQSEYARRT